MAFKLQSNNLNFTNNVAFCIMDNNIFINNKNKHNFLECLNLCNKICQINNKIPRTHQIIIYYVKQQ